MKLSISGISRGVFASALMTLALAMPVLRASAAAVVAKPDAKADVTVTDDGRFWTLDNGIVKARINKSSGNMPSLVYHGLETMGPGGFWEETPELAPQKSQTLTIDPAKNGGERAEVAVKGVTGGAVMLTPNAPGGGTYCDIEIRYTLGRGDSGIYTYAIFSHPREYGVMDVNESRFITQLSGRLFDWLSVDADRNMLMCSNQDERTGVVVHAKEQRVLSQGIYKNSVEHKYSYSAVQYRIPAFGWSSTKEHIGVFFINPTTEFLSGGASKQELCCHMGATILDYWRGTHYDGGAPCEMAAGEEWNKVIGPIFVYCNNLGEFNTPSQSELDTLKATEGNPTLPASLTSNALTLWEDALSQAKVEKGKWPYEWVNGIDYPHKDERATVTGQIVLNDPQAATMKLPHLMVGLAHPDYTRVYGGRGGFARGGAATAPGFAQGRGATTSPAFARGGGLGRAVTTVDWRHDAKFYQFWNDGSEDGKFAITQVRPGNYTLHAYSDGVLGELAQANITVEPGKTLDLGKIEWKPIRYGQQIWEIGYPSRETDEFLKGDGADYWLWGWYVRYPLLFPNDVTYTVGQSDYHKDWFFEQVPHSETTAWLNPNAKDPANQRFGWVKAESLEQYPQTNTRGPWEVYGRGRATTWTIKFNMDKASKGLATLRVALSGSDGNGGLAVGVNGKDVGSIRTRSTNALRYNTNKSVWYEYSQPFDASLMKQGANEMTLTVPAGELTSGVVYDYLRLELDENRKAENVSTVPPAGQ